MKAIIVLFILGLAACQSPGGFCDLSKPIRMTPEQIDSLSDKQVREYLGHNQRGERLCGWKA